MSDVVIYCPNPVHKRPVLKAVRRENADFSDHTCEAKLSFHSQSVAERYIENHYPDDEGKFPYVCNVCRAYHIGFKRVPFPKTLFVCNPDSYGKFKIQCADNRCRKSSKGNGWYEIEVNGCGGYTVRELPNKQHPVKPAPFVVEAVK
jgi:hypothetical protein